jgi:flavin reductase (DIM6/NTAB) family NADH-FMN oxidoreductase RutF
MNAEFFKEIMRRYPTGITIASCRLGDLNYGVTMNSFISISLNPPLIGVFVTKGTTASKYLTESKRFVINILAEDQEYLAVRFSSGNPLNRFQGIEFIESEYGPIINNTIAYLACELYATIDIADNVLIIGIVKNGKIVSDKKPLIYFMRKYIKLL